VIESVFDTSQHWSLSISGSLIGFSFSISIFFQINLISISIQSNKSININLNLYRLTRSLLSHEAFSNLNFWMLKYEMWIRCDIERWINLFTRDAKNHQLKQQQQQQQEEKGGERSHQDISSHFRCQVEEFYCQLFFVSDVSQFFEFLQLIRIKDFVWKMKSLNLEHDLIESFVSFGLSCPLPSNCSSYLQSRQLSKNEEEKKEDQEESTSGILSNPSYVFAPFNSLFVAYLIRGLLKLVDDGHLPTLNLPSMVCD